MMKRCILFLIVLAVLLAAGCGSSAAPETVRAAVSEPEATPTPKPTAKPTATPKPSATPAPRSLDAGHDYVLNTNTMKFHYPDCSSVNDIADKNREDYHGTAEELIEMGYTACGRCKPK